MVSASLLAVLHCFARATVHGAPLPALQQLLANPVLDCPADQLPRPEAPVHTGHLLLDSIFGQHPLVLHYGPVAPQIAAVTGFAPSEIAIWFQKGPGRVFGQMSAYGSTMTKCIAFRERSTLEPKHGPMLFIDARGLGKPVCSRIMRSFPLRVEDLLEAIEFSLPRHYEAHFTGGAPIGRDPLVLRFDKGGSATIWVVNLQPGFFPDLGDDDTDDGYDEDEGSRDDDGTSESADPPLPGSLPSAAEVRPISGNSGQGGQAADAPHDSCNHCTGPSWRCV